MKRLLIVGGAKNSCSLITFLANYEGIELVAIIDQNPKSPGVELAKHLNINSDSNWDRWLDQSIDIIIETTNDETILENLIKDKNDRTFIIPAYVAKIFITILNDMMLERDNQQLILNNIGDGMIITDEHAKITFMNKRAEKISGYKKEHAIGTHIKEIIHNSRIPQVLQSRRKEQNEKLILKNGKQIITTRIPIINASGYLVGAIAIFKDITEVVNLAEENTDLKEIKMMLEAIIQSSDEAISVVDENGIGLMINPAYTRITGLNEEDVIGKPATADISEGESMHYKVLKTRRPVRGAKMKVGPNKKEVIVNAAPVIVNKKLKGSVGIIHDVSEIQSLTNELKRARQIIRNLEARYTLDDIIGSSTEIKLAIEQAKVGAKTPATVLLRGESGTGKELFAHAIHNESDRKYKKFIRVNCAAIAESILESELFGYEDGAFSGAKSGGKKGLFEEANQGSIFLDEIGELSLSMQSKLLRVLQENEIVRVGGTSPISLDVRIIAATNINLEKAIMNGTFREDLYYRLNRLPITIPPLRERITDLPELTRHVIEKVNTDYGRNVTSISNEAMKHLQNYHWPGNIRELENVIGRAMIYMDINDDTIEKKHLPNLTEKTNDSILSEKKLDLNKTLQHAMEGFERDFIYEVYKKNECNKVKTAKQLNISIRNLYYKLNKYKID